MHVHTHTYIPFVKSQGSMPGGAAAMSMTERGNVDTKKPRLPPQTCSDATDVCAWAHTRACTAHTHAHSHFLHMQMRKEASQSSLRPGTKPKMLKAVCLVMHTHKSMHTRIHTRTRLCSTSSVDVCLFEGTFMIFLYDFILLEPMECFIALHSIL